jgi:hypothetical protein
MKRAFKSILQSIAQLVASESGELLSTRRKAQLLQREALLGRKQPRTSSRKSA